MQCAFPFFEEDRMNDPIFCWCWNEGARTTAPSIRLIREIIDGAGIEVNGYHWARVRRISDGHPDPTIEHVLMQVYTERCFPARDAVATVETTEQPRPSALSRIWAILRGRG
jgi:hypothetical protein